MNYKPRNTSFDKSTPSRATCAKNDNVMLKIPFYYVVREKRGKGVRERGKGVRGKTRLGEGEVPVFVGFSFFPLSHEGVPSFLPVRQHNKIPTDNLSVQKAHCAEQSPIISRHSVG